MRQQLLDLAGGLDAGALRHAHVHEHDVGHGLLRSLDGLGAVGGLTHELDVGFLLQHHLQPAPEQRMVVDDHHAKASARSPARFLRPSRFPLVRCFVGLFRIGRSFAVSGF